MTKKDLTNILYEIVEDGIAEGQTKEETITSMISMISTLTPENREQFAAWGRGDQVSTPDECWV